MTTMAAKLNGLFHSQLTARVYWLNIESLYRSPGEVEGEDWEVKSTLRLLERKKLLVFIKCSLLALELALFTSFVCLLIVIAVAVVIAAAYSNPEVYFFHFSNSTISTKPKPSRSVANQQTFQPPPTWDSHRSAAAAATCVVAPGNNHRIACRFNCHWPTID